MLALLLQSLSEYAATTLHSMNLRAVLGEAADFVVAHPLGLAGAAVGVLVLGWLLTPRH